MVQERLGHAHISVTLQTYSHVPPTMHDDAAALVANLVMPDGATRTPLTLVSTVPRQDGAWDADR